MPRELADVSSMFACLRSLTRALSIPGPVSLPSYSLRLFSAPVETGGYKSVLKSLRKQLGQHLLKHPDVVKKIVDSAAIAPTEFVLEIGPGTGNMTVHLLQQARAVLAVELDERMYEAVMTRVHALYVPDNVYRAINLSNVLMHVRCHRGLQQKFFCVRGDFLRMNLPPGIDVCVANIPYQASVLAVILSPACNIHQLCPRRFLPLSWRSC